MVAGDANVRGQRAEGTVYFIDGVRVRGSVNIPQAAIAQTEIRAYDLVEDYQYQDPYEDAKEERAATISANRLSDLMESYSEYENAYRQNFKDYAFFLPDVTTNADGRATVHIEYPDDITAWKTTLVGLGDDFRYFKNEYNTKSFLEVVPRLYVPGFLREGDSCVVIGKTLNYLDTSLSVTTVAEVGGTSVLDTTRMLHTRFLDEIPVVAGVDSLGITYGLSLGDDINTGEKRIIASEKRGVELYEGEFVRINADTSFVYANTGNQVVELTAMLGSGDILVHLADQLDRYPLRMQ